MSIEVKLSPFLTPYANKQEVVKVKGSTVGECLNHLAGQFPDLKSKLFDNKGKIPHYYDVYINGENSYPEELAKPVQNGDKLQLVWLIHGG
jgi:molybdopterin converting factor small subunit